MRRAFGLVMSGVLDAVVCIAVWELVNRWLGK